MNDNPKSEIQNLKCDDAAERVGEGGQNNTVMSEW
jgi:hypothetical protein